MYTRVALTLLYAIALAAVMALDNLVDLPSIVPLAALALAPLIGFFVGRWWVVLAVLGALVGRPIGWDSAENDGNLIGTVEQLTGRTVHAFLSDNHADPDVAVECFVLTPQDGSGASEPAAA